MIAGTLTAADKAGDKPQPANYNIPLWEAGKVPQAQGNGPLDSPFLTVFLPPEGKRNGASVVIAPGGSNIMLMYGGEGIDVAERYNDWGVTAFVLTYRLSPRYTESARVMEGKRAIQLVRARAAEWKLDPEKVGYIGFSAGSNMARSWCGTSAPAIRMRRIRSTALSSRPDYLVLVYGVGPRLAGRSVEEFPADVPGVGRGRYGAVAGQRAVVHGPDAAPACRRRSTCTRRAGTVSAAASAVRSSPTGWGGWSMFLKLGGFLPEAK